jgi:hypothetical protein
MNRLRRVFVLGICLWLFLSGGIAFALVSLEAEHEQEHTASAFAVHDHADHRHADSLIELVSELFAHPGFDQLTSASIGARCQVPVPDACALAPIRTEAKSLSEIPVPPPGPPPRPVA